MVELFRFFAAAYDFDGVVWCSPTPQSRFGHGPGMATTYVIELLAFRNQK